jgi:hypothetical protein
LRNKCNHEFGNPIFPKHHQSWGEIPLPRSGI